MIVEDKMTALRRIWRNGPPFGPFRPLFPCVTFVETCVVLGDGLVLARVAQGDLSKQALNFMGGEERVLALLAAAYLRPMPARTLDHMRRAARDWVRDEKCLAYIHLAFGGLAMLKEPEEAAFRLFVADGLMKAGSSPHRVMKAFGFDPEPLDLLEKYSPDQPRVPQGNGRASGQWTAGGAISSATSVATSAATMAAGAESFFVEDVAPRALAGLSEMAAGFSAAALTFGLLFIPSPGGGSVIDGAVPGQSNLLYHWDQQAGQVVLSWSIAGNAVPFNSATIGAGGLYYDASGQPIARVLNGVLVIDAAVATAHQSADDDEAAAAPAAALARTREANQPKLCPDPGLDVPHGASDAANAYQERVTGLPAGLAVWLNGVPFDGCDAPTGVMQEAKANYNQFIDENGKWKWWFAQYGGLDGLIAQLKSQSRAAGDRGVVWYVAEERAANTIRATLEELSISNIIVIWYP